MVLENLNFLVLVIFSPLLILAGIVGFITPTGRKVISTETSHNIYYISCGLIGSLILLVNNDLALKIFNILFGLINLYQLVAGYTGKFPSHRFKWTSVDRKLHLIFGLFFILVGLLGQ